MKRSVITAIALFLLVPSLSFAGSATSRYDVTIGGFVKFDMGYATKGVGADQTTAPRGSYHGNQNQNDEYGNIYAASGESRLNFLIKGPDGWGAKTSAFIEADFRGTQAGAAYGLFALRHAYIKMDWANTSLIIGQTWNRWGNIGTTTNIVLNTNDVLPFMRGQRQPQITVEQRFNKNWSASIGLYSPANSLGTVPAGATQVNNFTRSGMPFSEGEIVFQSDACGKIGPRNLLFGLGGYLGQEKPSYISSAAGAPVKYKDDTVTSWGVALKGFIPIIPEKKGDKTGALALSGNIFTGQDVSWFSTAYYATSYAVGTVDNRHYSAPMITGGFGNLQYYFTDKLFVTGLYGYASVAYSTPYTQVAANVGNVKTLQHAVINLSYDVNPALRVGVEYANIYTRYANFQTIAVGQYYDTKGTVNSGRIGAWYFF